MPNSMPNDDALIRSTGRIAVIRALLASRTWPLLSELAQSERDAVLDGMAQRDFQSEYRAELAREHRTA